jgi:hypothetical protein
MSLLYTVDLRFVLQPEIYVSTLGGRASFTCVPLNGAALTWLVNGSLVDNLNLRNVTTIYHTGGIRVLEFADIPVEYNSTNITCVASSNSMNATLDSKLVIQG